MDVILSRFSASELRGKCLSAVQEEIQHAETQLHPALAALKRALSVVQASRKMHSAPLALVDESPDVALALEMLVAACNEMGALVCEISRHVSSSEGGDASSSATDDEEPTPSRAEPKAVVHEAVMEKKKAAKETLGRIRKRTVETCEPTTGSDAVIDLSLSDDDKVVKNERSAVADGGDSSVRNEEVKNPRETPMDDADGEAEAVGTPRRRRQRKRKAPRHVEPPSAKRPVRDVVVRLGKRAEMAPSGPVGDAVRSALNAAIAVEDSRNATEMDALITAFVSATAGAGKKLVKVHAQHPVQAERHLEDMRLLMSVAVVNLERELTSDQVRMAWKMTAALKQLHGIYPVKTKGLHRNCQQLCKYLAKEHKVPATVVKHLKSKLGKVMEAVADWAPFDELTVRWFDKQMGVVDELLGGRFEQWNPSTDPVLGKVVTDLERICTFGVGDAWNDRYASICLACSKMSRTTFVWSFDLADTTTNRLVRCNDLEPGIEDNARVEEDFQHVTSYDEEVRQARTPDEKKDAFDELIDRLRWIFNAVAMTRDQSLLPLHRFKRLNECMDTLVSLCDNGDALNLEGCIHLEKLLVVMRQVMHIRIDYADISKRETEMLLGLFPPEKRPRFGYPTGCKHST